MMLNVTNWTSNLNGYISTTQLNKYTLLQSIGEKNKNKTDAKNFLFYSNLPAEIFS